MWRYAAARTTGSSHLKRGEVCQDRFAVWLEGDVLFAAVSDGAGSAARAEAGAELAVQSAIQSLKSRPTGDADWPGALAEAFARARQAVSAAAASEERPVRDFACTLLLAALSPEGGAAGQIGDGVIALRDSEGDGWSWVFWPQKGEYANTTHFLTDPEDRSPAELAAIRPSVFEIVMMTDGLEALALNFADQAAHDPFFEGVVRPLRQTGGAGEIATISTGMAEFLASPRVSDRADDDLTLLVATRVDV